MISSLEVLANDLTDRYSKNLHRILLIFPNKRAGLFFRKYLSEQIEKPIFSPKILSIDELMIRLSSLKKIEREEQIFLLYETYRSLVEQPESFDEFVTWGDTILADFNDIDKQIVDAHNVLINVKDLKEIDSLKSYLTEDQIETIRSFWKDYHASKENEIVEKFQQIWSLLFPLYEKFSSTLRENGMGYEGLIYRDAIEQLEAKKSTNIDFDKIIFVGLNALTLSERKLLSYLKEAELADFFWDYEGPFIKAQPDCAGKWEKENTRDYPSNFSRPEINNDTKINVHQVGVSSFTGQSRQVSRILSAWRKNGIIKDSADELKTAVVLSDSPLLIPTLYNIPDEFTNVNVAMGYPLSETETASLMNYLQKLYEQSSVKNKKIYFYYRDVLNLLAHPFFITFSKGIDLISKTIREENKTWLSFEELTNNVDPIFSVLFRQIETGDQIFSYLKELLFHIYERISSGAIGSDSQQEDEEALAMSDQPMEIDPRKLEKEFLIRYHQAITRLSDLYKQYDFPISVITAFRMINNITHSISIPFSGEPLNGLQIMGLLETRLIDFENIIFVSANEGIFPPKRSQNSFIPFSIRKAFSLPTYRDRDAIYAYHFYRMISRSKNVYLLYNATTQDMQSGEPSRFIHQLEYLYRDHINFVKEFPMLKLSQTKKTPVVIRKTNEIMEKLNRFCDSNSKKALSPSAINLYINDQIEFFRRYVEREEDIEDEKLMEFVEANVFGTIFHNTMAKIYSKYKNEVISEEIVKSIIQNERQIIEYIEESFNADFFKNGEVNNLRGYNFLICRLLLKEVKRTLEVDLQKAPFAHIDSEREIRGQIHINDDRKVNIRGTIDRIDVKNDILEIIDYKTGNADRNIPKNLDELFVKSVKKTDHLFQILMYSMMMDDDKEAQPFPTSPKIYAIKEMFKSKGFSSSLIYEKNELERYSTLHEEFSIRLRDLLSTLFDQNIPFMSEDEE